MSSGYPSGETLPAPRAIDIARWATIVATCSVMVSPPLANAAMAVMLMGLLASGQAGVRLRQACTQPLGIATLLLISVIGVAMLWGDAPWRDRWAAFWSWRKLWMIPVALALFGPLYWKRRLAVAYVAVCGVAMIASFVLVAIEGRLPTMYELALSGSLLRNHSAQSMAFATAAFVALWLAADPYWRRAWRLQAAALAALFVLNMAHSNEAEWLKFRNNKDNEAFIDRVYLVKVPYCLRVDEEVRIYDKMLKASTLSEAPCAPQTLRTLAEFSVLSRLAVPENSSVFSKLRSYNGENLKDIDPRSKSVKEYRDDAGMA